MIYLKTFNDEKHILIGIHSDFSNPHILLGGSVFVTTEFNRISCIFNHIKNPKIKSIEILGIFDKEKNEVDFISKEEWVKSDYIGNGLGKDMFDMSKYKRYYFDYLIELNSLISFKESYLSLLQSVTKGAKENKFVILKQLDK